jgi:hypothetical protein
MDDVANIGHVRKVAAATRPWREVSP